MTALSVVGAQWRLKSADRAVLIRDFLPWAVRAGARSADLMCLYYEEHFQVTLRPVSKSKCIRPAHCCCNLILRPVHEPERLFGQRILLYTDWRCFRTISKSCGRSGGYRQLQLPQRQYSDIAQHNLSSDGCVLCEGLRTCARSPAVPAGPAACCAAAFICNVRQLMSVLSSSSMLSLGQAFLAQV